MTTTVQQYYNDVVRLDMLKKLHYNNTHQIPKIDKIVLSMGIKEAVLDRKQLLMPLLLLELISGQKAIVTYAKKAISNFKIRKGFPIGAKVTLRGDNMYYFITKLIMIVLPRIRDFHGLRINSVDTQGNISFGIRDLLIFPEVEVEYDKLNKLYGMHITIVTTCKNAMETQVLLSSLQIPFKK